MSNTAGWRAAALREPRKLLARKEPKAGGANVLVGGARWWRRSARGKGQRTMKALVGILMGSRSDWEVMSNVAATLEKLGVPHEVKVISAHRTPELLTEYATTAEERGIEVIVAGAGGAAHLPGVTAAQTALPVLGVPMMTASMHGMDSLLSIVQMPAGIPVGTLAIGKAGAVNAALLAAAILAGKHPEVKDAVRRFRAEQTRKGMENTDPTEVPA